MQLRTYALPDAEALALAGVYRDAVMHLCRKAYSEEQRRVWAQHPMDLEDLRSALSNGIALCVHERGTPVVFGQLWPADHIAYLFCRAAYACRGYAFAIVARLEDRARSHGLTLLRVEASRVARPFFERLGYRTLGEERPIRHGLEIPRYRMEKGLVEPSGLPKWQATASRRALEHVSLVFVDQSRHRPSSSPGFGVRLWFGGGARPRSTSFRWAGGRRAATRRSRLKADRRATCAGRGPLRGSSKRPDCRIGRKV